MTLAFLKKGIRRLYEGATPNGVRFRYALLAFDIVTVLFIIATSFLPSHKIVEALDVLFGLVILADYALADHYAIPHQLHAEGIRRYGFHGLSYEYISRRLPQVAPEIAGGRIIVAHLGSGASMCAVKGGKSVESTMGFTALDGLAMGTRPGQIDPGVVLYLISEKGMSASNVQNFLYRDCGLKGLSGVSNDMRELETSADPRAAFAIDYFVYRIGLNAGMLAAALQGLDAFVFTAGIGENSVSIRARIAEKLLWLGVALDPAENARHASRISRPDSRIPVYVVPTDEELMIAQHTLGLLTSRQSPDQKRERVS